MRWQRIARWALAVFVLAFAAIVVVSLRRPARPVVKSQTPRVDQKTIVEVGPLTHTRTNPDGSIAFVLEGKRQLVYPDGRNVLFEAELTVPEKNGRTLNGKGGEMEVITPPTGDTQFQTVNITKGARLTSSDGLDVTSDRAAYDQRTAIVTIPGDVQFTRGRLSGSGLGATYDRGR